MVKQNVQVPVGYYETRKYDKLERFISYYYQVDSILGLGVKHLLEIGPGNGFVQTYLGEREIRVETVDSDSSLKPDFVADIRSLPLPDNSYEAVMACQILEHIPFADYPIALREINRVTKKYAIISLPQRCTTLELVIKFPLIKTLFGANFFDWSFSKFLRFPGFEESGQHYWEIDNHKTKLQEVRKPLQAYFKIVKEFSPVLNKYHRFFVLEKR